MNEKEFSLSLYQTIFRLFSNEAMKKELWQLPPQIELGPPKIHLICSGACFELASLLYQSSDFWHCFWGVEFLFGENALRNVIGYEHSFPCNKKLSLQLAMKAYQKAFEADSTNPIGVGLSTSMSDNYSSPEFHVIDATVYSRRGVFSISYEANCSLEDLFIIDCMVRELIFSSLSSEFKSILEIVDISTQTARDNFFKKDKK